METIQSLCPYCNRRIDASILIRQPKVYLHKSCPEHGESDVLISTDANYFARCQQTAIRADPEHPVVNVIEVTGKCQLACPICYSESSPAGAHRSLEQVERMIDAAAGSSTTPSTLQISGGEPCIHPDIDQILQHARLRHRRLLRLDTNGIRISQDDEFAKRLTALLPNFEVMLQFDSLRESVLKDIRGEDITSIRRRAIDRLNKLSLPTTLNIVLKKGQNDDEMGAIIDFAIKQKCVRGVTFQPIQTAGRTDSFDPARDRLTLSEVRQVLLRQTSIDVAPVSTNPHCLASASIARSGNDRLRINIIQFFDAFNFDAQAAAHPVMQMIDASGNVFPFDEFNVFQRNAARPSIAGHQ